MTNPTDTSPRSAYEVYCIEVQELLKEMFEADNQYGMPSTLDPRWYKAYGELKDLVVGDE